MPAGEGGVTVSPNLKAGGRRRSPQFSALSSPLSRPCSELKPWFWGLGLFLCHSLDSVSGEKEAFRQTHKPRVGSGFSVGEPEVSRRRPRQANALPHWKEIALCPSLSSESETLGPSSGLASARILVCYKQWPTWDISNDLFWFAVATC